MIFDALEVTLKDGMKVILRSPSENDAEEFTAFRKLTSAETHFMARNADEIDCNIDSAKRRINNLRETPNGFEISAFVGAEVAGSCGLNWKFNHEKLSHRASFGISIKKKYWGNGLGSLLLKETIEKAKTLGLEQIELGVFADNERAQELYKKFGFKEYGRLPNAYKLKDGTYRDEILMYVSLK